MVQAIGLVVQLGLLASVCLEVWLHHQMSAGYAAAAQRKFDASNFPVAPDLSLLSRLEGETASVAYRWDPEGSALLFRRHLSPVGGEWGHAAGLIRYGTDGAPYVHWHPFPLTVAPGFALMAVYMATVIWITEGSAMVFMGVPIAWLVARLFFTMQVATGRALMVNRILPELAEVMKAAQCVGTSDQTSG